MVGAHVGRRGRSEGATRRAIAIRRSRGDRIYRALGYGAGALTLVLLVLIGIFLLLRGWPELRADGFGFFTSSRWTQSGPFGIVAVMYWTLVISVTALVIAVPFSIAAALFITEICPRRLRRVLTSLVDLLAAVPSLIYGLWGLYYLQPQAAGVSKWLTTHLGFIPVFKTDSDNYKSSAFIAAIVVALMITPIITSVVREVFSQAPAAE